MMLGGYQGDLSGGHFPKMFKLFLSYHFPIIQGVNDPQMNLMIDYLPIN